MALIEHLEMKKLAKDSMYSVDTGMPELLNLYLGGYVTLETMVILQDFDDYLQKWEPIIMLWHDHFLTIKKSKRFVKYDQNRLQSIYNNFTENLADI